MVKKNIEEKEILDFEENNESDKEISFEDKKSMALDIARSASAQIIADANKTEVFIDATGRKIEVRRLNVFQQSRLSRAVGSENAQNEQFMMLATCAAMISKIDGDKYGFPSTIAMVDEAIKNMGDASFGMIATLLMLWTSESNKAVSSESDEIAKRYTEKVKK